MKKFNNGDLVVLRTDRHTNLSRGAIGIVTSAGERTMNVVFPQGSWVLPKWELWLLTKERACTQ